MQTTPRCVVFAIVLAGTSACASRPSPKPHAAAAAAPAKDQSLSEVLVSTLPRGRSPDWMPAAGPEVTTGLYVLPGSSSWISGVKKVAAEDGELRDEEGAQTAFCVRTSEPHFNAPVAQFAIPLEPELHVRAERVGDGSTPWFDAWSVFVTRNHELRKTDESSTPLARVAAMEGVEVFAFFEERGPNATPRVNVVVRRPPLHSGRARYASFFVTPHEGASAAASCGHAHVAIPVERGNGAAVAIDVVVEQGQRVRPLHVDVSVLWLTGEPAAHLTTRLRWRGPARDEIALNDLAHGRLEP